MVHWTCKDCDMHYGETEDEAGECDGMQCDPLGHPDCPLTEKTN